MKRIIHLGLFLLAGAFLTCSHAFAQAPIITVTQSQNFSLADTSGNGVSESLPAFNSAGPVPFNYTLTEVDVSLNNVILTGQVTITNQNATHTVSYTGINLSGTYDLTYADPNVTPSTPVVISNMVSVAYPDSTPVAPLGTYTTATTASASPGMGANVTTALTDSTSLAHYAGDGTATIVVYLSDILGGSANGNFQHQENENGTGTGTVVLTYIYTPVPEPTTTAAWMLGICLFAYVGRRYLPNGQMAFIRS